MTSRFLSLLLMIGAAIASAQVYSPNLLRTGQPDSSNLKRFADSICAAANAHTPREKAEAIWRFFLTDGRFVAPGYWYHIAGWSYEEPFGEVLDPIKLLNSYGFGLCYHIAPLLEAVYDAAGLEGARCWFLTGHTVTEVFYDGHYHYFDSDMMGYNVAGDGSYRGKPVVSVRDLEQNPDIILGKLQAPNKVKPGVVDEPWYPADVRASAMTDLANLFSSTGDNFLYPFTRYASGHRMDFTLRPGETLTRFFEPEEASLYYLPYRFDGKGWEEFPQEISEYHLRTSDGPRSQKDKRLWATGRFDYRPPTPITQPVTVISMPSPYVIIDAKFKMNVTTGTSNGDIAIETSTDNGGTWELAGELRGIHQGQWSVEPKVIVTSPHGRRTAVSGTYGYQIKITKSSAVSLDSLHITTRVQLNPRSLPFVEPGKNRFVYRAELPIQRDEIANPIFKAKLSDMDLIDENAQVFLRPHSHNGEALYTLALGTSDLTGFDVGARFLDLRDGLAPDKLTAETRRSEIRTMPGAASISWSLSAEGPYREIWRYDPQINWRDGDVITRLLRWPDVLKHVQNLPPQTKQVFVKLQSAGPAIDNVRLALYSQGPSPGGLQITQIWNERGRRRQHIERIAASAASRQFTVFAGSSVKNVAVIFSGQP